MPRVVRENLLLGKIGDAAEVLINGSDEITHILSVLGSTSISVFTEWRSDLTITSKEINTVHVAAEVASNSCLLPEKLFYTVEYAGKDLKLIRMTVPIRDLEGENLLDYLEVCLDYIDACRKEGCILVHCFAGVSRSASIVTAYLMRSERLSLEDALASLRQSCEFVYPNDGFLGQLKLFEEMGFRIDHSSSPYKLFRLKELGIFGLLPGSLYRLNLSYFFKAELPEFITSFFASSSMASSSSRNVVGGAASCAGERTYTSSELSAVEPPEDCGS